MSARILAIADRVPKRLEIVMRANYENAVNGKTNVRVLE